MAKKYVSVSGSVVGARAKKMVGCDVCNFMVMYTASLKIDGAPDKNGDKNSKSNGDKNSKPKQVKPRTGGYCPRCANKTLRIYDSRAEFTRGQELKMARDRGDIQDLEFQPRYSLSVEGGNYLCDYVADFQYREDDTLIVEDVKGSSRGKPVVTEIAQMKMKHFEAQYGFPVRVTTR